MEHNNSQKNISFVFFGTSQFSVDILDVLKERGFLPKLIVTQEDKPQGRHFELTPPPTKVWAQMHNIPVYQPSTLKDGTALQYLKDQSPENGFDVFIVASYGKIIPEDILHMPKRETLNVHPSLLPKHRGPSPITGAILEDNYTGVTIMHLDTEMDHGPIIAQKQVHTEVWPPYNEELEHILAAEGAELLATVLPDWVSGTISETEQNHTEATYTKKIKKVDAEINLLDNPEQNLRKIRAYSGWPNAYTYFNHNKKKIRVILKTAEMEGGMLSLKRVIPEGKREMDFEDFKRGL